jgi:hypothetical protein
MRAGVDQVVAVGWAPAQVPARLEDLGVHRGQDPVPGPHDFPAGLGAQQQQQRLMRRIGRVQWSMGLRQPQLHPVSVQQGQEVVELITMEGPLVLPTTIASNRRSGSAAAASNAAACGRSAQAGRHE